MTRKFSLVLILSLLLYSWCYAQATKKKPNILVCIADDASFEHFSANGCTWIKTPAFDRMAAEGLLFRNAYTPNAKCAPSRASILTGRNPWQLEELGNHLAYWPARYKTVFEDLEKNHYAAGFTGKGWAPGVSIPVHGNPHWLTGKPYNNRKLIPPTTGISEVDYVGNFNAFLNEKDEAEPFIFWMGFHEPHRRFEYGSGVKSGKQISSIPSVYTFWPDNDSVRNDMLDYALEIEYMDQQLGKTLDLLEEKKLLDNTIVVFTSDNGMAFPRIKGFEYEYSNHMPLAIMWKDGIVKPGRVIDDYVSLIDLTPTILELTHTRRDSSVYNRPQGKSLTNIFYSENAGNIDASRDHVLLGQERHDVGRPNEVGYPIRSLIKEGMMYIHNFEPDRWPSGNPETGYLNTDGGPTKTVMLNANRSNASGSRLWQLSFGKRQAEELYDIRKDPQCMNNLIHERKYKKIAQSLKTQLFTALKREGDPRMYGKGYLFDIYPPSEGLNFYNNFLNGVKQKTGWVEQTDYETDPLIIEGKRSGTSPDKHPKH